jgi:hypothetical protein
MSYLKDREIWLSSVPTGNPPVGYFWVFVQNGVFVVRDSNGVDKIMASTAGSITTAATASYVQYSNVANKPTLVSGSAQITYSGVSGKPEGIVSSSVQVGEYGVFATTGSNQFNGSQAITGSLTVTGQVVAQTLNVQQVTSSIVFSSGSNIFGNDLGNTQQFTGSLQVSGSSHYVLGNMGIGTITPLSRLHINTGTNQNLRVRPGTDVGATNGVALNSRSDDDGTLLQLALRASDVIMLPSGNVGINTASPSDFIDAGLGLAIINTTGRSGLSLGSTQGTANEVLGRLSFTNTNSTNIGNKRLAYISGIRGTSDNSAYLEFGTADNALGTQRMVISQAGNVGIGISPDYKLDVSYSTSAGNRRFLVTSTGPKIIRSGDGDGWGLGYGFLRNDGTDLGTGFGGAGNSSGLAYYFIGNSFDNNNAVFLPNGNVGIGTLIPDNKLAVWGTNNGLDSSQGNINVYTTDTAAINTGGSIGLGGYYNTSNNFIPFANITGKKENSTNDNAAGYLAFLTRNNSTGTGERMRITSGGNVCMGIATSPTDGATLTVSPVSGSNTGQISIIGGPSAGNPKLYLEAPGVNGAGMFYDRSAGLLKVWVGTETNGVSMTSFATSWSSYSDERLKTDLVPIDNALDKIKNIRPFTGRYKTDEEGVSRSFLIAQDIINVFPEAIHESEDEEKTLSLRYTDMIPLMMKAIQELKSENDNLKSRLEVLEQA